MTENSVTPGPPPLPASTPFTLPSTFSTSALDTLNEEMQLTFEIANLQLLLEGSLSDRFIRNTNLIKRNTTLGFPISITPPAGKSYRNAVAEIMVTVSNTENVSSEYANQTTTGQLEAPGLLALLPREKTYNVASITDKSISIGGGAVVAQVLSVGANWLRGSKTYYVVQDQDTVAIQKFSTDQDTRFGWWFRPVLGQKSVRSGLRQTFAQLAFPVNARVGCVGKVTVTTQWRKYDPKTGIVGDVIENSGDSEGRLYNINNFNLTPIPGIIEWEDLGGGQITVNVTNVYMPGTSIRVGSSVIPSNTPGLLDENGLHFKASAADVASLPVFLVGRDGAENPLVDPDIADRIPPLPSCTENQGKIPPYAVSTPVFPTKQVTIGTIEPRAFSDTLTEVVIPMTKTPPDPSKRNPLVVLIGTRLFGLKDAPLTLRTDQELRLRVPTDLLRSARSLTVKRLFFGATYSDDADIPFDLKPVAKPNFLPFAGDFAPAKVTILSQTEDSLRLALTGSGLQNLKVVFPDVKPEPVDSTLVVISLTTKALAAGLKQIVVRNGSAGQLMVLDVPTTPPKSAAPVSIKEHDPIKVGKDVLVEVLGDGLENLIAVVISEPKGFSATGVKFTLTAAKTVVLALPNEVTDKPGEVTLQFQFKDKLTIPLKLKVT